MDPILLRERDVAHALGVSPSQVGKWSRAGLLQPIRVPGLRATRYLVADVRAFGERLISEARGASTPHGDR